MGKLKIKIRRKPLEGNFTLLFFELFPLPKKKIYINREFGILTACSKGWFIGLQMLISSIAHFYDVKLLVLDIGMTSQQIEWCKKQPGVIVKPFKIPEYQSHIQYAGAWFKPHYIYESPFKHTIWIDCDAMVVGDLRELIDWSHPSALFTSDHTQLKESTLNHPNLYSYMPIGKAYYHDICPYINSGVFIINKKRDEKILSDWKYCVDQACSIKSIADTISCWDQGSLKWSLHKNDKLYLIVPDKKFNYPATIRHFSYPATPESVIHWMKNCKPKDACIVLHWMGSPKPWRNWGEMLNIDLTILNETYI